MIADVGCRFDAVMHFVVAPDRYYAVELREGKLWFLKSGSQFDLEHPGAMGRGKMGESAQPGKKPPPKSMLILGGVGVILGSIGLFVVMLKFGFVSILPVGVLALGFVMLMAGFVTPRRPYQTDGGGEERVLGHPHNFAVAIAEIESAALLVPANPEKVARLNLTLISGKTVKLILKTPGDLATVRQLVVPVLGSRVTFS